MKTHIIEKQKCFKDISSNSEIVLIATGLGFFCLLLWLFFLFGFRWPAHDTAHVFYPWRAFFSDSLHKGIFPLWDSWNTPGFQITFLNSPIWYPVALIFGLLAEFNTHVLIVEIVFISWLSSIGCYFWLRSQQIGRRLALCGAISWVASAPFVTSVQGMGIFTSIAFLPWVFLGSNLLVEGKSLEYRLAGVVAIALSISLIISGGYLAVGIPILTFAGIYFIALSLGAWHDIGRICLWTAVAGGLTALLIALPIMDYFQVKSVISELRGKDTGFDPFFSSLPAISAWSLLVANGSYLFGVISGRAEQMYMGVALVLAIPVSLTVVRPGKRDVGLFFLAVFVFFASMGPESPVASFFVRYVPLMGWFRFHVFWSNVVVFLLITLSVRLIQKLVFRDTRGAGYGQFVFIGILITGFLIGIWISYSQSISGIAVFSFFEIVQYCLFILAILLIPLSFLLIRLSTFRKWNVCFLLVGLFAGLIFLFSFPHDYGKVLEQYIFQHDGVFSPVLNEMASLKDKMILGKIGFPSIYLFGMDICQFVVVASVFCFLIFVILKRNTTLFLSCMVLLVVLDMSLGAQRYFHGEPKWLGVPKPSENIMVAQWNGVLSKVNTTPSFQYVMSRVPVPIVKEDLVEINIDMQANFSGRKLEVILYQPQYNDQRLSGTAVRINGKRNIYRVQMKSLYASFNNPIVEIRNYSLDKEMFPVKVTLTVKRTKQGIGVERETFTDYRSNDRIDGDFDIGQFDHVMVPMTETYTPLFNPAVKKLLKDSRTEKLFTKLLWVMPNTQELTKENSSELVEEPVIRQLILKPNALYVQVELTKPSLLIWTDGWHEGWDVTVNTHVAELKQPLGVLKGVELPEGISDVYFHYSPNYVRYGVFFSILGLIGVFVIVVCIVYRGRLKKTGVYTTQ